MKKKKTNGFNMQQTLFCVMQLEALTTNLRKNGTFPTEEFYNVFGDIEMILVNYSQKMEAKVNEQLRTQK